MVRGFETHKIRRTKELTSCLWDFELISERETKCQKVFIHWMWLRIIGSASNQLCIYPGV